MCGVLNWVNKSHTFKKRYYLKTHLNHDQKKETMKWDLKKVKMRNRNHGHSFGLSIKILNHLGHVFIGFCWSGPLDFPGSSKICFPLYSELRWLRRKLNENMIIGQIRMLESILTSHCKQNSDHNCVRKCWILDISLCT